MFPVRRPANRALLATLAVGALAIPALAQDRPVSILPPGFGNEQAPPANSSGNSAQPSAPAPTAETPDNGDGDQLLIANEADVADLNLPPPPPPVEVPGFAARDPRTVGAADPRDFGLGSLPWGDSSGAFLSTLMRRLDTPMPSRWLHIALRNALLARAPAPRNVNPVDWAAERAWLLLRMGEADAARLIVGGVDVRNFTPKMTQVAVQSALANADPSGLCPLLDEMKGVEDAVLPLTQAMCSALSGSPESAAAQVDSVRRRGRVQGIDLNLADKVIGAGADTARAVTIEWDPVDELSSWRFGLATATAMPLPDRLINAAPLRMRAWQARSPLLSPEQRLASARIATGLGVFSSNALVDTYAAIYDTTDLAELGDSDAWRVRLAYAGRDEDTRLKAMRKLWGIGDHDPLQLEASRALLARAATGIAPDAKLQDDAVNLIASMLAGGLDRPAERWANAVRQMDGARADEAWALLALGTDARGIDVGAGRANDFIGRDTSQGKQRSALLVAGLAGLGRIGVGEANRLSSRNDLGLGEAGQWTRMIDGAAARRQPATVLLLAAIGMQAAGFDKVPAAYLYHAVAALKAVGLEYQGRMIAAEALARA